jgi:hypothetical protein
MVNASSCSDHFKLSGNDQMLRTASLPIVVVGIAWLACLAGCGEAVKTPTSFKKWNATDGLFALEYPEDWEAKGGGKQGIQWAEFKKSGCVISIDSNVSGSVVAQGAGALSGALEGDAPIDPKLAEKLAPAAVAHEFIKKDETRFENYKNYKEEEPTVISPPIGEGRKSLFTASTGGRKIKGYRITIPTNDKAIIIFAYGPEKEWGKLQGAYDQIFSKMEHGIQM